MVKIRTIVEEPALVKASNEFEAEMARGDTIGFCQSMAAKARQKGDAPEAQVWGFMQVIFGEFIVAACIPLHAARHRLSYHRYAHASPVFAQQRQTLGSSFWNTLVIMRM